MIAKNREKVALDILSPTLGPVKVEMQMLKPFQYEEMKWQNDIKIERPYYWIGPDGRSWFRPKYGNLIFDISCKWGTK
jgi:hypothetical protein